MTAPDDAEQKQPVSEGRVLAAKVRAARASIFAERVWEAALWPVVVAGAFIALSLLGAFSAMPAWAHLLGLVLFAAGFVYSLKSLLRLRYPSGEEGLRRLERDAGLKHRPATSYTDTLGDSAGREGRALWEAHRARLSALFSRLRPSWPRPRNERSDPYAVRIALALTLIVAIAATGAGGLDRLKQALTPQSIAAPSELRVDAWVTPPGYTGKPPMVLADGALPETDDVSRPAPLNAPENSVLVLRAHATGGGQVSLRRIDSKGEASAIAPKPRRQGDEAAPFEFEFALTDPTTLELAWGGSPLARWAFTITEDTAPRIALSELPTQTPRAAVRLGYAAEDDYGVTGAEARFALADADAQAGDLGEAIAEAPTMPFTLPRAASQFVEGHAHKDLTAHPWAGLKVAMTLTARDHAGQTGVSTPHEFVLPERVFTKPLAKALIAERRELVRAPSRAQSIADRLDRIAQASAEQLTEAGVYLGLRSVYWRLRHDPSAEAIRSVVDQLWEMALKIEDGDLPEAERNMQAAQEKLMEALQNNASDEEIEKLVEELRQAMNEFLKELQNQQAARNGEQPPQDQQPQAQDGDRTVSQQELDKLLDAIEQLSKSGSKDMAQKMLSEMRDVLERLQNGNMAQSAEQQQQAKTMQELQDMIREQQKLLDDTFEARRQEPGQEGQDGQPQAGMEFNPDGQYGDPMGMEGFMGQQSPFGQFGMPQFGQQQSPGQQGQQQGAGQQGQEGQQGQRGKGQGEAQGESGGQGGQPGQQAGALAQRQAELRKQLQDMMDQMRGMGGQPPQELEGAGSAMGDAQGAISQENLERATEQQTQALDQLRQGAQSMADQMMQSQEGQQGQGQQQGQRGPGRNGMRDPLGRPERSEGPDLGLSVKVPDEIDVQRAREILDEVRRRLGDPNRPNFELDYLERLIRRF
jgi:uncharacterized protein (TIGR02302 family)